MRGIVRGGRAPHAQRYHIGPTDTYEGRVNTVSRRVVLDEKADTCPALLPCVRASFQSAPPLLWEDNHLVLLLRATGDPLGPSLFANGLQRALSHLASGLAMHSWYLDDLALLGPLSVLEAALSELVHRLLAIGLNLNSRNRQSHSGGIS